MPLHCLSTFPTDTRSLAESRDWFLHIRFRAVSMAPSQSEIASPALEQKPKRVYGRKRDRDSKTMAGSVLSRCFIASICRVSKRIEKWPPGNSLRRSAPGRGRLSRRMSGSFGAASKKTLLARSIGNGVSALFDADRADHASTRRNLLLVPSETNSFDRSSPEISPSRTDLPKIGLELHYGSV